ncbi:MAG: endonuclease MutS2 [Oscillospiraceae bacterium]|jgi:DNA mismatch repair protein MutS2|nr:endonuclease MutS2 [Oscillospiraceae bacterium]
MTLYEKSLRILELPAVLGMLADEAVAESAKETARALTVCGDMHEAQERLDETTAAKIMADENGWPPFAAVRDVRGSVRRADMGGTLGTAELLDVATLLRVCSAAASYAGRRDGDADASAVSRLFLAIRTNKPLERKISAAIAGPDEISDTASAALADIRRRMRATEERIRAVLNRIISSQTYAPALQEALITSRNGRYVVPVKSERKSSVPGLVHDVSSTGATLFIEPAPVVEANNELREMAADEKREIERILAELSADCAACGDDLISDFEYITELDFIFAKAKLSYKLKASAPELSERGAVKLLRARHPLLPAGSAVPIDLQIGAEYNAVVITGPNTGGKTVALKTLGLLCAMAMCGLHIPAGAGSAVPAYRRILADIGDEQSIEQSLSTFSSHMTNIVSILGARGSDTLMLFDELGAGTDPSEGAALAVSIIEYARASGAAVAATTHYSELKTYALTSPGVVNASCEFDVETLRPTYRLLMGVPGKSNAFAISRRLGLPEEVLEDAARRVDAADASLEDVLGELEAQRRRTREELEEAERALETARADAARAAGYLAEIRRERDKAEAAARREAGAILGGARAAAAEVMERLDRLRAEIQNENNIQTLNRAKADIFRKLNEADAAPESASEAPEPPESWEADGTGRAIVPGDTVMLSSLGARAVVEDVGQDGLMTLRAGAVKITARPGDVTLTKAKAKDKAPRARRGAAQRGTEAPAEAISGARVGPELDLRGMASDEAADALERYLDDAVMSRLETVTVIHGKGTGALRRAVHERLRRSPGVASFRLGRYGEGETGVTVVSMRLN